MKMYECSSFLLASARLRAHLTAGGRGRGGGRRRENNGDLTRSVREREPGSVQQLFFSKMLFWRHVDMAKTSSRMIRQVAKNNFGQVQ